MSRDKQQGFTIIELTLAMTFLSVLLLAIALTIIQIGNIYSRGMTLREVNQTGRLIDDDVSRSLATSGAFSLSTNYVNTANVGGRLCVDRYSYLWNYGSALDADRSGIMKYQTGGTRAAEQVHFVRVEDPSGAYCARSGSAFVYTAIRAVDQTNAKELLAAGDRELDIHQLSLGAAAAGANALTGQQLYQLSFTIGTGDATALNPTRTACLPPSSLSANFSYCAVQQFNLVIRAGNGVN